MPGDDTQESIEHSGTPLAVDTANSDQNGIRVLDVDVEMSSLSMFNGKTPQKNPIPTGKQTKDFQGKLSLQHSQPEQYSPQVVRSAWKTPRNQTSARTSIKDRLQISESIYGSPVPHSTTQRRVISSRAKSRRAVSCSPSKAGVRLNGPENIHMAPQNSVDLPDYYEPATPVDTPFSPTRSILSSGSEYLAMLELLKEKEKNTCSMLALLEQQVNRNNQQSSQNNKEADDFREQSKQLEQQKQLLEISSSKNIALHGENNELQKMLKSKENEVILLKMEHDVLEKGMEKQRVYIDDKIEELARKIEIMNSTNHNTNGSIGHLNNSNNNNNNRSMIKNCVIQTHLAGLSEPSLEDDEYLIKNDNAQSAIGQSLVNTEDAYGSSSTTDYLEQAERDVQLIRVIGDGNTNESLALDNSTIATVAPPTTTTTTTTTATPTTTTSTTTNTNTSESFMKCSHLNNIDEDSTTRDTRCQSERPVGPLAWKYRARDVQSEIFAKHFFNENTPRTSKSIGYKGRVIVQVPRSVKKKILSEREDREQNREQNREPKQQSMKVATPTTEGNYSQVLMKSIGSIGTYNDVLLTISPFHTLQANQFSSANSGQATELTDNKMELHSTHTHNPRYSSGGQYYSQTHRGKLYSSGEYMVEDSDIQHSMQFPVSTVYTPASLFHPSEQVQQHIHELHVAHASASSQMTSSGELTAKMQENDTRPYLFVHDHQSDTMEYTGKQYSPFIAHNNNNQISTEFSQQELQPHVNHSPIYNNKLFTLEVSTPLESLESFPENVNSNNMNSMNEMHPPQLPRIETPLPPIPSKAVVMQDHTSSPASPSHANYSSSDVTHNVKSSLSTTNDYLLQHGEPMSDQEVTSQYNGTIQGTVTDAADCGSELKAKDSNTISHVEAIHHIHHHHPSDMPSQDQNRMVMRRRSEMASSFNPDNNREMGAVLRHQSSLPLDEEQYVIEPGHASITYHDHTFHLGTFERGSVVINLPLPPLPPIPAMSTTAPLHSLPPLPSPNHTWIDSRQLKNTRFLPVGDPTQSTSRRSFQQGNYNTLPLKQQEYPDTHTTEESIPTNLTEFFHYRERESRRLSQRPLLADTPLDYNDMTASNNVQSYNSQNDYGQVDGSYKNTESDATQGSHLRIDDLINTDRVQKPRQQFVENNAVYRNLEDHETNVDNSEESTTTTMTATNTTSATKPGIHGHYSLIDDDKTLESLTFGNLKNMELVGLSDGPQINVPVPEINEQEQEGSADRVSSAQLVVAAEEVPYSVDDMPSVPQVVMLTTAAISTRRPSSNHTVLVRYSSDELRQSIACSVMINDEVTATEIIPSVFEHTMPNRHEIVQHASNMHSSRDIKQLRMQLLNNMRQ